MAAFPSCSQTKSAVPRAWIETSSITLRIVREGKAAATATSSLYNTSLAKVVARLHPAKIVPIASIRLDTAPWKFKALAPVYKTIAAR
eukprot:3061113-Pyramimonas_sp.AAC.1